MAQHVDFSIRLHGWRFRVAMAILAAALLLALLPALMASATGPVETKLLSIDAAARDGLGYAVALDDDTALVGAKGAAYLFQHQADGSWAETARLAASDSAKDNTFGRAVALDGDTALVGAYGAGDSGAYSGAAYLFERQEDGAWAQVARLTASDGAAGDWFGYAVALSGDSALVGAFHGDDACPSGPNCNSGAAYLFQQGEDGRWTQAAKLVASDGAAGDWFGSAVVLEGDSALIGAQGVDDTCPSNSCSYAGAAYLFEQQEDGDWTEVAKLEGSHGGANHWFGSAVALSDGTALVGSYGDGDGGQGLGSGAVYLFQRQGDGVWAEAARLTAGDGATGDYFGEAVAIDGNTILVGAGGHDGACTSEACNNSGAAYLFQRQDDGDWMQAAKLTSSNGAAGDSFGSAVALSEGTALVGARGDDGACASNPYCNSGAAYAFAFSMKGEEVTVPEIPSP